MMTLSVTDAPHCHITHLYWTASSLARSPLQRYSSVCIFQGSSCPESLGWGLQAPPEFRTPDSGGGGYAVPWSRAISCHMEMGVWGIHTAGPVLEGLTCLTSQSLSSWPITYFMSHWCGQSRAEEVGGVGSSPPSPPLPRPPSLGAPCLGLSSAHFLTVQRPRTTCSGKAGAACGPHFSDGKTGPRERPGLRSLRARPRPSSESLPSRPRWHRLRATLSPCL